MGDVDTVHVVIIYFILNILIFIRRCGRMVKVVWHRAKRLMLLCNKGVGSKRLRIICLTSDISVLKDTNMYSEQ